MSIDLLEFRHVGLELCFDTQCKRVYSVSGISPSSCALFKWIELRDSVGGAGLWHGVLQGIIKAPKDYYFITSLSVSTKTSSVKVGIYMQLP